MKLLFDANLSPSLVGRLSELFPDSVHVETLGIEESDTEIWKYARENGLTIVSKDSDFAATSYCSRIAAQGRLGQARQLSDRSH